MATRKKTKKTDFKRSGKMALEVAKDVGESMISGLEAAFPGGKHQRAASRRAKVSMSRARKRLAGAIGGAESGSSSRSSRSKKSVSSRRKSIAGKPSSRKRSGLTSKSRKSFVSKSSRARKHG